MKTKTLAHCRISCAFTWIPLATEPRSISMCGRQTRGCCMRTMWNVSGDSLPICNRLLPANSAAGDLPRPAIRVATTRPTGRKKCCRRRHLERVGGAMIPIPRPEVVFTVAGEKTFNLIRLREVSAWGLRLEGVAVDRLAYGRWKVTGKGRVARSCHFVRVPERAPASPHPRDQITGLSGLRPTSASISNRNFPNIRIHRQRQDRQDAP